MSNISNIFNPEIWGPHYWFFLYTMALSYPLNPNDVSKRKYYDFIQNLPLTPYLDSRESMIKWVHFIHNKINVYLGKPELTYYEAMDKYYQNYKLKDVKMREERTNKHKYIYGGAVILLVSLIIYLYFSK